MPSKDTTPLSLYGNDREYLREQERTNELLADIAGETYDSPGNIPNGKYILQKRMLDAAQKKNELLESIAEGGGGSGTGSIKGLNIDYSTDVISLKNKSGETIEGSGATLPAYGLNYNSATGGLTLTKNGTAVQGQTVSLPDYGSPLTATSTAGMTDTSKVYVNTTDGKWYYHNGTAWVAGGTYNSQGIDTDTTLLVSGAPADAKATGDAVSDLKTQLLEEYTDTVTEDLDTTWTDGYTPPNGSGSSISNSYERTDFLPVQEGDIFKYQNTNFRFRYVAACDSSRNYIESSGATEASSYTVPSGISFIRLTRYKTTTAAVKYTHTVTAYRNNLTGDVERIDSEIDNINNDIDGIESELGDIENAIIAQEYKEESTDILNSGITWTSGYKDKSGVTGASSDYKYSNKIAVREGDVIHYSNTNFKFRFITAYNDGSAVSASGAQDVNSFTVPSGINYVILSIYVARENIDILRERTTTESSAYVKPIPLGYMMQKGNLSNGERLTLPFMQVKNYNRIVFNANITSFSSVRYSLGTAKVEVNDTNLLITNGNGTSLDPIPHSLTIGNNITLIIETETEEYINHVRVCSDGTVFDYNTKFFAQSESAAQYIESVDSALTECVLSWVSESVNAPIWLFGDSYFAWYYNQGWTYYLAQDGFAENVMLNGYSGQASNTAYNALVNLLAITTPKIVVWCLGMNNADNATAYQPATAVNATWKDYYDKILELEKKYGFELVLYTTPTTPKWDNSFKDAIVRNSQHRYIEIDKAVRIDDSGNWITGALNTDDTHPTESGAKIIYHRFLADLPEIMCKY